MPAIPSADVIQSNGTVTLLFTDIEGSTSLWEQDGTRMSQALAAHDVVARRAVEAHSGRVVKTTGDGIQAVFQDALDALIATLDLQQALADPAVTCGIALRVRCGVHAGVVEQRDDDYFGSTVNRAARIMSAAHGGQVLLSQAAVDAIRAALPPAISLRDLGNVRLKDLATPEHVYQAVHEALPREFPVLRSLEAIPNNLPQQATSFIGRASELTELKRLLAKTRLLTLTGSGGCGKTRLSLQVAADCLEHFPDGAWLAELAPLSDPLLVPQTVAALLGLKEAPGRSIIQALTEHLKDQRMLLLLDNCEHLLDGCVQLVDILVRQCPRVTILASSRENLGIAGEQSYRVPSLSLPDPKRPHSPEAVAQFEAVQLFADRALLANAAFKVTAQSAGTLAHICHRLDGIPLAIELAASRVRSLSVEEIDGKLDQRFRLLTGGSRTALPRQQTLRSLIDWSYDLLRDPEKLLLQRLAVFSGGWTLDAAEKVCAGEGMEAGEVLDLLTSLFDKSLVMAEQSGERSRYRLLETVRQYAREKLVDGGGSEALRDRHRNYFGALADEAEPKLKGKEQAVWMQRLGDEYDNVRSALEWSLVGEGSRWGLRLCGALQRFWWARGYLSEGREWCVRILGMAGAQARTQERAKALNTAGVLAYNQSDYSAARALNEESLAIQRELSDQWGMANSLNNLGNVAWDQGDYHAAKTLHEESLAIMREIGDRWGIARSLTNLGNVAWEQVDYAAARALHEESLATMRELGDKSVIAASLFNLGVVAQAQRDYPAAEALYQESLIIEREMGYRQSIANSQITLGGLAMERGDFAAAKVRHREALVIGRELGDKRGIAMALEGLAAVFAGLRDLPRAARVWGAAERLRIEVGSPQLPQDQPDYDRYVAAARAAQSDDVAFDRAWQQGGALTLEQAIELAMQDDDGTR